MNHTNNPACPHLGLLDDASTSLGFPSKSNYCHHSRPIARPRLKHQEQFCLGGQYGQCPLFLSEQAIPLPAELKIPGNQPADKARAAIRRNILIAFATLFILFAAGWGVMKFGIVPPAQNEDATQTIPPPPSATEFFTETLPAPLFAPTNVPTPTSVISSGQFDTPLGGTDDKFVIHKVLEGENLAQLALKFETSVETILAINYIQKYPAWRGSLLIIPVKSTDPSKFPGFEQYLVTEADRGASADELAKKLQTDSIALRYYNGWSNTWDRPIVGELVLVPRAQRQSKHQLDMLVGTDYKFVIHRVINGETLEQFAVKFDTSVEAIEALNNANNRVVGWSGTFLIVPVGFTDYSALPGFTVYAVQESDRAISIEDLAKKLKVNPTELQYYNGLTGSGDRPLVGDYLLVPRARISP